MISKRSHKRLKAQFPNAYKNWYDPPPQNKKLARKMKRKRS